MKSEIFYGDCLEVMSFFEAEAFDAIITDPPYGIDFQSNRRVASAKLERIANDDAPYLEWLPDAYRLTKTGGCLFCFCRWDVQEVFRTAIEEVGYTVRSQVVWDKKHHGMGDLEQQFSPMHEVAWFATKGKYKFPGKRPNSVISVMRPNTNYIHPTEKPFELMRTIIEAIVPPGGTIFDPFSGSGSTVVAATTTGRCGAGAEIHEPYYKASCGRLEGAMAAHEMESFFE